MSFLLGNYWDINGILMGYEGDMNVIFIGKLLGY